MAKHIKEIFTHPNFILKISTLVVAGGQMGIVVYLSGSTSQLSFFGLLNSGVITIIIALLIAFIFFESTPRTEICLHAGCIMLIRQIMYQYWDFVEPVDATIIVDDQFVIFLLLSIVEVALLLLDVIFLQIKKETE